MEKLYELFEYDEDAKLMCNLTPSEQSDFALIEKAIFYIIEEKVLKNLKLVSFKVLKETEEIEKMEGWQITQKYNQEVEGDYYLEMFENGFVCLLNFGKIT